MTDNNRSKQNSITDVSDASISEDESATTATEAEHKPPNSTASSDKQDWQNSMLPWMIRMVVGLTIFFFIASLVQLFYLHWEIRSAPRLDPKLHMLPLDTAHKSPDKPAASSNPEMNNDQRLIAAVMAILSSLEANAVERRYHQANVSLMSRVWTRYLGFVTGMVLAMVGAIFILGKLREKESQAAVKTAAVEMQMRSASPGLILAGLGTVLMLTTILTHHEINVQDAPLYTQGLQMTTAPQYYLDRNQNQGTGAEHPPSLGQQEPEPGTGGVNKETGVAAPSVLKDLHKKVGQPVIKTPGAGVTR